MRCPRVFAKANLNTYRPTDYRVVNNKFNFIHTSYLNGVIVLDLPKSGDGYSLKHYSKDIDITNDQAFFI